MTHRYVVTAFLCDLRASPERSPHIATIAYYLPLLHERRSLVASWCIATPGVTMLQDPQLRAAAQMLQDALNASTVEQEEALWCAPHCSSP